MRTQVQLATHGFPKTGTHALVKACQAVAGLPCDALHLPFAEGLPVGTTHDIFIVRDPRNILVSTLRMRHLQVSPGAIATLFRRYQTTSLRRELALYEPWLGSAGLVVRHERLCDRTDVAVRRAEVQRIADYLGAGTAVFSVDAAAEQLLGWTLTWNATPSDFRPYWNEQLAHIWRHEGGDDLLARWGY